MTRGEFLVIYHYDYRALQSAHTFSLVFHGQFLSFQAKYTGRLLHDWGRKRNDGGGFFIEGAYYTFARGRIFLV